MQQTWTFDAPSGVYKNHNMSEQLRFAAIAETKFMQFTKPEPGYGKKKGESVTITRVSNLDEPNDGRISENQKIPEDELVLSTIAITVSEFGRSVPYTSLAEDLGAFDLENIIQKTLRDQMKLVMDKAAAAAFKTGQIKATADGVSSLQIGTAGVAPATASANLNVYHIEQIRDYMHGTLHIPAYEGDDYIGLVSTKAKRGIMQDPAWEPWHRYTDPEAKYNSEIGRLENIRFIEINNSNALSKSLGTNGVCGEAVFFGADAVAMAVVEDPELRAAIPGDFGRSKAVAWYGILEFGQIWADSANAGEARVVHFTSL
jgi:N4-gp56 family major capsid protein